MSAAHDHPYDEQRTRAQEFVDRGWFPFPVEYRGKRPGVGIKWGTATASVPTDKMLDLWFCRDRMNIGIAARPSRLVILDADRLNAMEELCAAYGQPVPVTYRVRTAKGWHYYFDAPDGVEIGNSPGALKEFGFDVRGGRGGSKEAGGYVVAAGSVHATGHVYSAEDDNADTVELPWWITELLLAGSAADTEEPPAEQDSDPPRRERRQFTVEEAQAFVRPLIDALAVAGKGEINEALNRAARTVAHFGPEFWTRAEAERRLMQLQLREWHDGDESAARATIASAYSSQARDEATGARDEAGRPLGWRAELVERGDPFGGEEDGESEVGEDGLTAAERVRAAKVAEALDRLEVAAEAKRLFNAQFQPRASAPAPMSLTELLALPDEPIRYRVDGLLGVGGRILLAAAQKAGKTTLMGNLVRCLLDGGDFLGRHHVEPVKGRVVLLDTELPTRTLKDWLARQGIANQDGLEIFSLRDRVTSFNLTDPAILAEWVQILTPLEPGFVVLDCLRPVLDGAGLDESKEAGRFLVPFGELLGRAGVQEACLVQHMGHTGERARGDSGLLGWADANWKIVRKDSEDDHSTRFFSAFGRDVDVPECELGWNSMTNELRAIGGNRKESVARSALPVILEVLSGPERQMSGRQIEAEMAESDFTRAVIREALRLGIRDGRIAVEDGPKGSRLHSIRPSAPSAP